MTHTFEGLRCRRGFAAHVGLDRMAEVWMEGDAQLLRHLLQPFLRTPLPVTLSENLVTFNMKPIAVARSRNEQCDICQANPSAGFGDCGEAIGLAPEIAAALLDEDDTVIVQ